MKTTKCEEEKKKKLDLYCASTWSLLIWKANNRYNFSVDKENAPEKNNNGWWKKKKKVIKTLLLWINARKPQFFSIVAHGEMIMKKI